MNLTTAILEIVQQGEMLVLKPVGELHDLDELELEGAAHELLERMDIRG
jgi:virulence-associated protein VagC